MPRRRSPAWFAVIAAALGYAWIAAGLRPFTTPEEVFVAVPIVPVVLLAAWPRRSASEEIEMAVITPPRQRGAVIWIALFAAAAAWELLALSSTPRDDHPTLSSIADRVMSTHPGRAAVFALWLALGAALVYRRPRDGEA
jgi:hypothetical protein